MSTPPMLMGSSPSTEIWAKAEPVASSTGSAGANLSDACRPSRIIRSDPFFLRTKNMPT